MAYGSDTSYRVVLQVIGMPYYKSAIVFQVPLYTFFFVSLCSQLYLIGRQFCARYSRQKLFSLMFKMIMPFCLPLISGIFLSDIVYGVYITKTNEGKLIIALFSPLGMVAVKVISRICVQRLWNITHPGYSYVLLAPLYFGSAIVFRVLHADLDTLQSIATLGIIHGAAEVAERSIMALIDHVGHML